MPFLSYLATNSFWIHFRKCILFCIVSTVLLINFQKLTAQESPIETKSIVFGADRGGSETFTLSGNIIGTEGGDAIIGATILVQETGQGAVSDENGDFTLRLSGGQYSIQISFLGYADQLWEVGLYESGKLEISLAKSSLILDQVVIEGQSQRSNIESTISGIERLNIEQLEQRTQLLGELDVLRSIQTLSGVTSVGDGASGFNVRGGNADENLILQDDALIINPAHTLGFFSLFHPDLINSVELYKGNQPAHYGGRLSSVLQVDLREGNREDYEFRGGVGMAASRLTFEGPIQKGKSSFIVGSRLSYMDYLLNLVKNINVKRSSTIFYDVTVKADARLSDRTKVGFSSFISGDEFQFGEEVNFDYTTKTASAYLNHIVRDNWNLRATFNIGDYESSLFDIQGSDLSRFTNGVGYLRGALRNFIDLNDQVDLIAGLEFNRYTVNPGELNPEGSESTAVPERLDDEVGQAISPFFQITWSPSEKISFVAAARFTNYSRLGPGSLPIYQDGVPRSAVSLSEVRIIDNGSIVSYQGWEPRASLNYKINKNNSIKLGYNRGYQYLNQLSNTASATPIDIWKLSDFYIAPQTADNFNVGWFSNMSDDRYSMSLETFYKDQKSIVEYRDFADLLLNEFLEREIVEGIGRSYGIEVNFAKNKGDTKFEFNYTYSRSERRVVETPVQTSINNGDWYPSNFDKPHSFNLNFSRKTGRITNLSINFTYSTGRPITGPIGNFGIDNVLNVPIFSQRNQFRIPDYHRLDVAYTIGPFGGEKSNNRITLSVYNLYSRRNAYSVFFRQRPFQSLSVLRIATLGSIFPSITYNFNFK